MAFIVPLSVTVALGPPTGPMVPEITTGCAVKSTPVASVVVSVTDRFAGTNEYPVFDGVIV